MIPSTGNWNIYVMMIEVQIDTNHFKKQFSIT